MSFLVKWKLQLCDQYQHDDMVCSVGYCLLFPKNALDSSNETSHPYWSIFPKKKSTVHSAHRNVFMNENSWQSLIAGMSRLNDFTFLLFYVHSTFKTNWNVVILPNQIECKICRPGIFGKFYYTNYVFFAITDMTCVAFYVTT